MYKILKSFSIQSLTLYAGCSPWAYIVPKALGVSNTLGTMTLKKF